MGVVNNVLVVIICVSSFVALRVSFCGFGELLMAFLFTYVFYTCKVYKDKSGVFLVSNFWLSLWAFLILGIVFNIFLNYDVSFVIKGMIFDGLSYLFILMACWTIEKAYNWNLIDPYIVLKKGFFFLSCIFVVLYILSFLFRSIGPFPLLYLSTNRFCPLNNNPHVANMMFVLLPFIGLYILSKEKFIGFKKILTYFLILINIVMAVATDISKTNVCFLGGFMGLLMAKYLKKRSIFCILSLYLLFVISFILIDLNFDIFQYLNNLFLENDYHGGRMYRYSAALDISMDSFLVGYGPGPHIILSGDGFTDAHSTIFTLLLQSGIIGLVLFILFYFRMMRKSWSIPELFAVSMSLLGYILFSDIMRRFPVWIILVLIACVLEQEVVDEGGRY